MFSQPIYPETLSVYRIALEYPDGSRRWWNSEFYKLQQTLGPQLFSCILSTKPERIVGLDQAVKLIQSVSDQDFTCPAVQHLCIIMRQCQLVDGRWKIRDEVVSRIRLPESKQSPR